MTTEVMVTAILTFLASGGGAWILSIWKQRNDASLAEKKQESDIHFSETEKAFSIYKEIVDSLKKDVAGLSKGLHDMEEQHIECREQNAKLNAKIDVMTDKVTSYELRIKSLEEELAKYKK